MKSLHGTNESITIAYWGKIEKYRLINERHESEFQTKFQQRRDGDTDVEKGLVDTVREERVRWMEKGYPHIYTLRWKMASW